MNYMAGRRHLPPCGGDSGPARPPPCYTLLCAPPPVHILNQQCHCPLTAAAVLTLPTVALDLAWGCTRLLEGIHKIEISLFSSRVPEIFGAKE